MRHSGALFWAAGFAGTRHGLDIGFSPADLTIHRYVWSGLAFLPFVVRGGISDLSGIGWGRSLLLALLGGPGFSEVLASHSLAMRVFVLMPLGHGGVIQPSCATLGGLFTRDTLARGEANTTLANRDPEVRRINGLRKIAPKPKLLVLQHDSGIRQSSASADALDRRAYYHLRTCGDRRRSSDRDWSLRTNTFSHV